MKMKNHAHHERAKSTVLRQVVKIRWVKQYRGYFEKWRKTAELMEVAATCHEAGVVRQEKNKFDQEIANLSAMLREEGYTQDEINKII